MKKNCSIAFLITAACLCLPAFGAEPAFPQDQQASTNNPSGHTGSHEAMKMVSAQAALTQSIDAKKATPGQPIEARLAGKVRLKNGPVLPNGTVLMGKVARDDMQENGMSKLALCFDQAKLKDGQTVPVKATIIAVFGPGSGDASPYPSIPGNQVPVTWTDGTLQVDQLNVMSGVDLHSKIASKNSGVLVSTKKDDVKLEQGTEFGLAIAAEGNGQAGSPATGGY